MITLSKPALFRISLVALLLCAPSPSTAQHAKTPKAPTSLSRAELVGLVHCLVHCRGEDEGIGPSFGGSKWFHLRYQVEEWDPTRRSFYMTATVYSARRNSGLFFTLIWDGKPCGEFTIINDGAFHRKGGTWRWTTTPLGGLGTLSEATSSLRSVMSRGHAATIDADTQEKGCGEWSTSV